MAVLKCAQCGCSFEVSARTGRPRKYCFECSPSQYVPPREKVESKCDQCGSVFVGRRGRKFCSDPCRRESGKRKRGECSDCGRLVWQVGATCRECRAARVEHGTYTAYKKRGCRCSECKEANRRAGRAYREKRLAAGRPVMKPSARRDCDQCGVAFLARTDTGQRYCSVACAKKAQGWDGTPRERFRVAPEFRLAIYEEDGWTCQLCFSPVRPEVDPKHPRYPTLDHIKPRSRGGSDDRENLRTACMQCNAMRGANEDWSHPEAVAS